MGHGLDSTQFDNLFLQGPYGYWEHFISVSSVRVWSRLVPTQFFFLLSMTPELPINIHRVMDPAFPAPLGSESLSQV